MAQLTKEQQNQIRSLAKDERWDALIRFVALKIEQWRAEAVTGENAFQELRALHTREGKVAGVNELFDQLERKAFE